MKLHLRDVVIVLLSCLNGLACFRGLDAKRLSCDHDQYCPSGYVCDTVKFQCVAAGTLSSDASSRQDVAAGDGSQSEVVVSGGKDDAGSDGVGGKQDGYLPPVNPDVPPADVPVVDPGTGGIGGIAGTGGTGGTQDTCGAGGATETGGIAETGGVQTGGLVTSSSGASGGTGGADAGGVGGTVAQDAAPDTVDAFIPLSAGSPCTTGAQCASTFCADGVCCDAKCDGPCETCSAAGKCTLAAAGPAPASRTVCPGTGTCGSKCDGKTRTCVYPGATVTCSDPTCTAGAATAAGNCNSSGTCVKPDPTPCSTGVCGTNGQCANQCTPTSCPTGTYCNSVGACAPKKAPGTACASTVECGAAAAVCGIDGVCCESECEGACQACNAAGQCVAVTGSPRAGHPTCNAYDAPCAGTCNGTSTSCAYPGPGTQCTPASCASNMTSLNNATVCNSNGSCTATAPTTCTSGYYCKNASCNNQQGSSGASCAVQPAPNQNIECVTGLACISNSPSGNRCCSPGQIACSGSCTDPSVEPNCGSCGTSCGANKTCQNKVCTCDLGTMTCGSTSTCAGSNFEKDVDVNGWSIVPMSSNIACCPTVSSTQAYSGSKALQFSANPTTTAPPALAFQWNFCPSGTTTVSSFSVWVYSTRKVSLAYSNVRVLDASGSPGADSQIMLGSINSTWTLVSVTFSPAQQASGVMIGFNGGGSPMSSGTFQVYLDDARVQ